MLLSAFRQHLGAAAITGKVVFQGGRSRGFGFVTVASSALSQALSLNGTEMHGRRVTVERAVAKPSKGARALSSQPKSESKAATPLKPAAAAATAGVGGAGSTRSAAPLSATEFPALSASAAGSTAAAVSAAVEKSKPFSAAVAEHLSKQTASTTASASASVSASVSREEMMARRLQKRAKGNPKLQSQSETKETKTKDEKSASASASADLPVFKSEVPLIDIGANLASDWFSKDIEHVLRRARDSGVAQMVITGSSLKGSVDAEKLAAAHPGVLFSTVGVHPHEAKRCDEKTLQLFEELAAKPHVVAIGETGLDFFRDLSPRELQEKWFERHVALACKLGKPLFLHQRDAHTSFMRILAKFEGKLPKVVVHCFTGSKEDLLEYVAKGWYVGITGFIGKKSRGKELRSFLKAVPLDRLMVETDCPYMLVDDPVASAYRSRNEPCTLSLVAKTVAESLGKPYHEVAAATTQNARTFFGLKSA